MMLCQVEDKLGNQTVFRPAIDESPSNDSLNKRLDKFFMFFIVRFLCFDNCQILILINNLD